jgi:hypothetical protein
MWDKVNFLIARITNNSQVMEAGLRFFRLLLNGVQNFPAVSEETQSRDHLNRHMTKNSQ